MNYILVCNLQGDAVDYHKKLANEIFEKFGILRPIKQKLDPHFTLKYQFVADDISTLDEALKKFCENEKPTNLRIGGFGYFDQDVIFLKTDLSIEAQNVHSRLILLLKTFDWMTWQQYDGENIHVHSTVASHCGESFTDIQKFLEDKEQYFDCVFNNITILEEDVVLDGITTWKKHAEFMIAHSVPVLS